MADALLPNGMRVTNDYGLWRGREYRSGVADLKRNRTPIACYGAEPDGEGFERGRCTHGHRWPEWSRWIPLDEVEDRYRVTTTAVWRGARFQVVVQGDDGDDPDDPAIMVDGPLEDLTGQRPMSWWLGLGNLAPLDYGTGRAYGWVPWSELSDLREDVRDAPFPVSRHWRGPR